MEAIENSPAVDRAKSKGWQIIEDKNLPVKVDLTDEQKIEFGEEQSKILIRIRELEYEKKLFDEKIKNQIKSFEDDAYEIAKNLKNGWIYENRDVAICLDAIKSERVILDHTNGNEVLREPMRPEDKQLRLV